MSSSKSESVGVIPGRDGTPVPPDIALFRRERELALLEAAVERAWSGRGSLIVCTGPAGSGRSKLLSVAAERAEQAGMRVLSATGRSAERDLDFGAALQLFEAEVSRADAEERERLLSGAAALAAPLLTRGPRGQSSIEPTSSILHGLYHLCAHLGQGGPLALAVDDAHCLDAATLRLLVFLSHRLDDLPFLLLLSTGAGASSPELDSLVYHPRATQVRL
ncbi:MAG: ATP-binding protein, partial [Thermoleophilaceae bacterium]